VLSLLFGPVFPWGLRRLGALLCCCSSLDRHPACPRRCCAAQRVRLEDFHRGPYQQALATFQATLEDVGRQASGSKYLREGGRGECCNKSGHGSGRNLGAFVRPHAQRVHAPQRNVSCQGGWGKGGNRERQAACCAGAEDAHHKSSSADATIAARR
jgi:hypothetical protein